MAASHHFTLRRHRTGPRLDGLVAGMVGISERSSSPVHRRQPAGTLLPLVLSFGNQLRIDSLSDGVGAGQSYQSFFSGFSTGHASTSFKGGQDCVQVYLTPIGVRQVLGVPGTELSRRVLPATDLVTRLDALIDRLACAPTWEERFAITEMTLVQRLGDPPPPWLDWMWQAITSSGGQVRIRDLVTEIGFSHRHTASVFHHYIGVTPKQAADVVRFQRASADLGRRPLAEVAVVHGYSDQSHLTRSVARFAGETPTQLAAAARPTPVTALGNRPVLGRRLTLPARVA